MNAFGSITRAAFLWLTAVMTLIAGLPHFRCQCPNDSVKPFCFGFACSASGGCCGNACPSAPKDARHARAAAPAGKHKASCCCCNAQAQHARGRADDTPRAQNRGCVKSWAQHQNFVPSRPVTADRDAGGSFAVAGIAVYPNPARIQAAADLAHLLAPPPSDLVIVLQRFLI